MISVVSRLQIAHSSWGSLSYLDFLNHHKPSPLFLLNFFYFFLSSSCFPIYSYSFFFTDLICEALSVMSYFNMYSYNMINHLNCLFLWTNIKKSNKKKAKNWYFLSLYAVLVQFRPNRSPGWFTSVQLSFISCFNGELFTLLVAQDGIWISPADPQQNFSCFLWFYWEG